MRIRKALAAALALAAAPVPAYAYLDPGSGGLLLQLLLSGAAGVLVVGKLYWTRLKALLFGPRSSNAGQTSQDQEESAGSPRG